MVWKVVLEVATRHVRVLDWTGSLHEIRAPVLMAHGSQNGSPGHSRSDGGSDSLGGDSEPDSANG